MHELPITKRIIEIAETYARRDDSRRVTRIFLVVGDYSGFVSETIQMYFDIIAEGTLSEGAELIVERVRPKLKCQSCGAFFDRRPFSFSCPDCGGEGRPSEIGKEFYIDRIEVEEERIE